MSSSQVAAKETEPLVTSKSRCEGCGQYMARAYKSIKGGLQSVGEKVGAPHGPMWRAAWIVAGIALLALAAGGAYGGYYSIASNLQTWYAAVIFVGMVIPVLPAATIASAVFGAKILLCSIRYAALDKPPLLNEGEKPEL